jgi:hypothetical protein
MRWILGQREETNGNASSIETRQVAKKPYHKPEVRFERVFETRALTCGKISVTQGQCTHNLKTS